VEDAWADSVSDDFLIDEVETLVRTTLAREGYAAATARATLGTQDGARVLTVDVTEGQRTGTVRALVTGVPSELAGDLAAQLEAGPLAERAIDDRDGIADEVVAALRARGYLRAQATADPLASRPEGVVVPVRVQPGPVFTVGRVEVDGTAALDQDRVRQVVGLTTGDLHATARSTAARDRIAALYRGEGFQDVRVTARENVGAAETAVDVTFEVEEGPRQVLREIVVTGNQAIETGAVVDAVELPLDQPVRPAEWLAARIRLFDTELFRRVDVSPEPAGPVDDGVQPIRAVIEVEEWPVLRLRYGFEVAEAFDVEDEGSRHLVPGVRADVIRRTLLGRAINVGLSLQAQHFVQSGRTFLRVPTMFGLPLESQVVVRATRETIENVSLQTNTTGFAWEQRYRVSPALRLTYSYDFERNRTFDTQPDPNFPAFDAVLNVAKLRASGAFDTRDDPSDATRGLLLTASLEYAPPALGSEIRFARYVTQAYAFRTWRGLVFASAARFGAIRPLGDVPLLRANLFFEGGARSVRGVAENGLGERDFLDEPAGGEAMLVLNQEVRFPLWGWLRGVTFLDAGNVFATPGDLSLRSLTGAAGAGLRLDTPFGLFRVDYGKQIWNPTADERGRWTFGIGQTF